MFLGKTTRKINKLYADGVYLTSAEKISPAQRQIRFHEEEYNVVNRSAE